MKQFIKSLTLNRETIKSTICTQYDFLRKVAKNFFFDRKGIACH